MDKPAQPTRIVDAHQHVFWHGRNDAGLVRDMDEHGIEYAWLLGWEVPPWEDCSAYHASFNPIHARSDGTHAGIPLADLLAARDHYPDRFIVGYCPHPAIGNASALLRAAVEIHGVKTCGEWKFQMLIDDPRCLELFRTAGELGLPVTFHLDIPYMADKEGRMRYQPIWYGGTVANLERALQACPETTFIGHGPGFWREISNDADRQPVVYPRDPITGKGRLYDLFERYPNLYADLSAGSALYALNRDPQNAMEFLHTFSDRLLFGRDYYGKELHEFLQSLNLSPELTEKIYYRNAEKLVAKQ
jgi:predicted TIM-barrel fold metal-dependent hydrolase